MWLQEIFIHSYILCKHLTVIYFENEREEIINMTSVRNRPNPKGNSFSENQNRNIYKKLFRDRLLQNPY